MYLPSISNIFFRQIPEIISLKKRKIKNLIPGKTDGSKFLTDLVIKLILLLIQKFSFI